MSKVERAKSILSFYKRYNIKYSSNLMDKDYKLIKERKSALKIFKYTKTEEVISENLASQIINHYRLGKVVDRLETFARRKSSTEAGALIFTYKVNPDYEVAAVAKDLQGIGKKLLRVIRRKKDNPLYDEKLAEFLKIYSKHCKEDPEEAYGVVLSYSILSILPIDKETEKKLKSIESVANELLNIKTKDVEERKSVKTNSKETKDIEREF